MGVSNEHMGVFNENMGVSNKNLGVFNEIMGVSNETFMGVSSNALMRMISSQTQILRVEKTRSLPSSQFRKNKTNGAHNFSVNTQGNSEIYI